MYRIIGADRKEYGPVPAEQIRQWIRENRANQSTMVRPEGAPEWLPLGKVTEFALDFAAPTKGLAQSSSLQPLYPLPQDPRHSMDYIVPESAPGIVHCLQRSWQLLLNNLGLLVGATLLMMMILIGMELMGVVGVLLSMVIQGPILGGLCALFLRRIRGQESTVSDLFGGFGPAFVHLMLTLVITNLMVLLSGVLFFVGLLLMVAGVHSIVWSVLGGMICCVGLLPPIYLSILWVFALPLAIDKQLDFSEAMQLSRKVVQERWWRVLGLVIVASLIGCSGLILLMAGAVFTLPLFFGMLMYAYEDLFGGTARPA